MRGRGGLEGSQAEGEGWEERNSVITRGQRGYDQAWRMEDEVKLGCRKEYDQVRWMEE